MALKYFFSISAFFYAITVNHVQAVRRVPAVNVASLLEAAGSTGTDDQCLSLQTAIETLKETFSCVTDYCAGNCQPNPPPTPPPDGPTNAPPTPPTTGAPAPPATTGAPPVPQPTTQGGGGEVTNIEVGTYLPNWFVYNKFYMGINQLNLPDNSQPSGSLESKYTFFASHLDPIASKLTHVYYAFWSVLENCYIEDIDYGASWKNMDGSATWIITPTSGCDGLMNDLLALKAKYNHLKIMVSVGGWTYSQYFSQCAGSDDGLNKLYTTFKYRFSEIDPDWGKPSGYLTGPDFDWEFPEVPDGLFPDHSDNDWDNFVKMIQYFRQQATSEGRTDMQITAAVGVGGTLTKLSQKPDVAKAFCNGLDHMNLMEYDIHGKWAPTTGHNAPFCLLDDPANPRPDLSVKSTVDLLIGAGCDPAKISLGIPNYSHAWTYIPEGPNGDGLYQTSPKTDVRTDQPPSQALGRWVGWSTYSDSDVLLIPQGIINYWDLKAILSANSDFQVHSIQCDPDLGITVPVKWVYSSSKQAFASYEDPETVTAKIQWAKAKGLGGFFFWDAQQDREFDIFNAATSAWGVRDNPATGSQSCWTKGKPHSDVDSFTGQVTQPPCSLTSGKTFSIPAGGSCSVAHTETSKQCPDSTSVFEGASRGGSSECQPICTPAWGAQSQAGPQVGDVIHYYCKGEKIEGGGDTNGGTTGGGDTNGGTTGGGDTNGGTTGGGENENKLAACVSCQTCVATPGVDTTDDLCQQCALSDANDWWPCNGGLALCHCA